MLSSVIACCAGIVLIAGMPLQPLPILAACIGWCGYCVREFQNILAGYRRFDRLRFDVGRVAVRDAGGAWHAARVLPGSLLLRRAGWIRFRCGRGPVLAEPIAGRCRADPDWRRLQVIWRHFQGQ